MRRMVLIGVLGLAACDGVFEREDEEVETLDPEDEGWSVQVFEGAAHVGTEPIERWPAPLGECVEGDFVLDALPEGDAAVSFLHAGDRDIEVEINGELVARRVNWSDVVTTAVADLIVDVAACTVTSVLPGDDTCDEIWYDVEVTLVARRLPEDLLGYGLNTYRLCAEAGDYMLADGLRLYETSESSE